MYEEHLTKKSIFFTWQTLFLLFLFFVIRAGSFFLQEQIVIQAVIVFCLIMLLGILYFKNPDWALALVLLEIFLGGAGHFVEFMGLSIRTVLIGFYLVLWGADQIGRQEFWQKIKTNKNLNKILIIFCFFLILSVVVGIVNGYSLKDIIQSLIPYSFLLLLFPARHIFSSEKIQENLARYIIVFIIGSALFSLLVFALYSSNVFILQDSFYHWYRDVNWGKITDLGNGFFRVVEPEHLLIVPFMLIISSLLMRDEHHHKMWRFLMFCSALILVLNFSRGYFLALAVGLLVLKYKHKLQRWFIVSATTVGLIFLIFISISLAASGGQTMGMEQFGIRILSLTTPQIEISSATRMMILPAIVDILKANPLLGAGLGASVTFFDSTIYDQVITRQFDWGYLQMWVELGLFGLLSFLGLVIFAVSSLIKKIRVEADWHDFDVGLLGGLFAFLVMNITAPALFHIFGIIFLIFALTMGLKSEPVLFERLVQVLYRVFNRLKSAP